MAWSVLRGIGHQLNPFDAGRTYDTNAAGRMPGYRQRDAVRTQTQSTATAPPVNSDWRTQSQEAIAAANASRAAAQAQTNAIYAQIAAMPKLPSFDILGNYNRARTQAEANMRPRYDTIWNNFLAEQGIKKETARGGANLKKEQTALDRRLTREDNETNRIRTAEDVAAAIEQINTGETEFQTDEAREFDNARRGLQEAVAGAGLTTSGIGANSVDEQVEQRNVASGRQTAQFEQQRQARELFKNRTFADLERGDLRADEREVLANKGIDFDLDRELKALAQEEVSKRFDWEADLLGAIGEETSRLDKEGVAQFINSLVGSGARAQDIALARQVYG